MSHDTIQHLQLDNLVPSPHNRRTISDSDPALQSLASSILALGVLEPLLVRPLADGRFEIIAGHRRHRACLLAKRSAAPCIVHLVDDGQAKAMTLVENLQREGLHFLDEAQAVADLIDEVHDPAEAAHYIGHDVRWVVTRASLRRLIAAWCDVIRIDTDFAWVGVGHAAAIARLPADTQAALLAYLEDSHDDAWTVADLEDLIDRRFLRHLRTAPWPLDDLALLPTAKACSDCPKRSSCQTTLWPDQTTNDDRCLDVTCWSEKQRRWMLAEAKRLAAKGNKVAIAVPFGSKIDLGTLPEGIVQIEGTHYLDTAKKGTPGAVQVVDYTTGKSAWKVPQKYAPRDVQQALGYKPPKAADDKAASSDTKGPTADDKRLAKRLTYRLAQVAAAAEDALEVPEPTNLLQIYAVVALEGGNLRQDEAWRRISVMSPETARALIWSDLIERLHNFGNHPVFATQLDTVGQGAVENLEILLDLQPTEQAAKALAEVPEPRGKAANLSGDTHA